MSGHKDGVNRDAIGSADDNMKEQTRPEAEEVEKAGAVDGSSSETEDSENEDFRMTWAKGLAMASFQLGYLSDVFVLTMASTLLQQINQDIGPSNDYAWMATAQVLGAAVMSPSVGRLSDIFGRRNFLLAGSVVAAVGCAVAATAKQVNTVIGAGAIIGVGSAMHQLAWSCLAELVPKKTRFLALGIFQATLAPSSAFAPVIAYSFVVHTKATWRGAYWLPFSLDVAALVLVFIFYRPQNQYIRVQGKTQLQQLLGLDWVGNFLLVSGLVLLLMGISLGGSRFPWKSAGTIAPIVIGFILLIALGLWETYASLESPIFPRAVFSNVRGFTVIIIGVFLIGMLYYSTAVLWPQQIIFLYTENLITSGWYASAMGLAGCVVGPLAGWAFARIGHSRLVLTATIAVLAVCSGAQAIVSPTSNVASTVLVALVGIAVASATIATTTMIQVGVSHEYIGIATGLAITARSVGGSVATTIYSTVLKSRFTTNLIDDAATPLIQAGVAPLSVGGIIEALLGGSPEALVGLSPDIIAVAETGIKKAFAHALRTVYLVSIAFGVVGVICVAFSEDVSHLMTNEVDVRLTTEQHKTHSKV
ncbi:trichothecene efflux pump [Grosmannia clavigera kw1407]|uniref:Trichothecene efflux pump n=1 Tax=Grosmannia clavigera (strain kw1407 / UAMH 11150) TaxID=655863 RepID=F0XNL1_GROCL|nr:trichothecene efflux pump [Grosmannia clavigera kw1407]EFX00504.1 trichothecene efflux pump [Grosmannia clavigera kw1407]